MSQTFLTPSSYTHQCWTDYNYKMDTVEEEHAEYNPSWYWMNDDQYAAFQREYGFSDKNAGYSGEYRSVQKTCNDMGGFPVNIEERAVNERQWEYNGHTYRAHYSYAEDFVMGNRYGIFLLREVELGDYYTVELEPETSAAYELQSTISAWYMTFRNIALVALLSILVYIGIRITLSSVASDKAKYKEMLVNWTVAICLVFLMHYIMAFSVYINEKIINAVSSITVSGYGGESGVLGNETKTTVKTQAKKGQNNQQVQEEDEIEDAGVALFIITGNDAKNAYNVLVGDNKNTLTDADGNVVSGENSLYINRFSEDKNTLYWKANDFMSQARLLGQQIEVGNDGKSEINSEQTEGERAGYNIIYVVLVIYTVMFCFTYLKRVIYMAFLTVIAPLVAITYPIDKMNDGKAQAFDMWLKEYIFNLLIQPLHLILYMILIGSAMKFAATNIFYAVIALGFLIPAEKLLRRFFGFEKAQTPGAFGGAAGAALMMSGLNKLMGHKPSKAAIGTSDKSKDEDNEDIDKPRMNKKLENTENLFGNNKDDEESLFVENENKENSLGYHKDLKEEQIDELRSEGLEPGDQEYDQYLRQHGINPNETVQNHPNNSSNTISDRIRNLSPESSKPKRKRSLKRAIGRGMRNYGSGVQKRYKANKAAKGGIIKRGIRMAGGVAGAATLATAGGIIGITSGDASKAAQYMATGAVGGYALGKGTVDTVTNKIKNEADLVKGSAKEAKKGYYGDDYKEHEQERYKKQFIKDQENLRKIEEKLRVEEKEAQEIAKRIANYTDYEGVNSIEDAIAVDQLVQEENYKLEEALMAASYSNVILEGKDTRKMKRDELREYQNIHKEKLEEKGISSQDATIHTANLFKAINKFNNLKD